MFPPSAPPIFGVTKRISRIGQGSSRVRPLHVFPPSAVRWTQPSTLGEISPPATHPVLIVDKEDRSIEHRADGCAASPSRSGVGTVAVVDPRGAGVQIGQQAEFQAEPATIGVRYDVGPVRCGSATVGGVGAEFVEPSTKSIIRASLWLAKRTRCTHPVEVRTISFGQVAPPSWLQRMMPSKVEES
jgi:hypothetical protein